MDKELEVSAQLPKYSGASKFFKIVISQVDFRTDLEMLVKHHAKAEDHLAVELNRL